MITTVKQGILNLKTIHLSKLGKMICPNAEYLRCAVPRKKKLSLHEALFAPQKLLSVEEMFNEDYVISLQQLKTKEFSVLTGLLFLDDFICKIELRTECLEAFPGFSAYQHRDNYNEAQLIITKRNFHYLLDACTRISYTDVIRLLGMNEPTELKLAC